MRESRAICAFSGKKSHTTAECRDFIAAPTAQRWKVTRKNRLCFSCLEVGHARNECKDERVCGKCNRKHHELLHYQQSVNERGGSGCVYGDSRGIVENSVNPSSTL